MPNPETIFRRHHVLEQQTVEKHAGLLKELNYAGLFDIHSERNLLNLPTEVGFAYKLGVSSHGGRHISEYQIGIQSKLNLYQQSVDYIAFDQYGDLDAGRRLADKIETLQDSLRLGLSDGLLYINAPYGLKPNDIRANAHSFFDNQSQFAVRNADAIRDIGTMQKEELGWRAIVHSEARVVATFDEMSKSTANLIRGGDEVGARVGLANAITQAHAGGRLTLSEQGISRFENTFGAEAARPLRIPPGQSGFISPQLLTGELSVGHTLRAAGIVASTVDALDTAQRVKTLLQQDNLIGAKHELRDYAATTTNAWLAAYTFGKLGAEMSVARGGRHVGAVAGAVAGGIIGYTMSDKAMAAVDAKEIRNQTDARNIAWNHNGINWRREIPADLHDDGIDQVRNTYFSPDPATSRYLDFKATNVSVAIELSRVPKPIDPYSIDAPASDSPHAPSVRWTRNPDTGHWEHAAPPVFAERGLGIDGSASVTAPPALAARLDAQSNAIISANIANGPAPIAARYNVAHHLNGWDTVQGVQRSPAVDAALDPNRLQASNQKHYTFGQDGLWRSENAIATGNIAHELTATRAALQPRLQQHGQTMAALPAWQEPTPEQRDLSDLATMYARRDLQPNLETLAAAQLAISITREQHGLGQHNSSLSLDPGLAKGQHTVESSIAHLARGQDGAVRPVAWTTDADIDWARSHLQKPPIQAATQAAESTTATAQPADEAAPQAERSLQAQLEQLRLRQARMEQEAQEQEERERLARQDEARDPLPQRQSDAPSERHPVREHDDASSSAIPHGSEASAPENATSETWKPLLPDDQGPQQVPGRKAVIGDPDVDDLLHAFEIGDERAVRDALDRIADSPATAAFLKQGNELLDAQARAEAEAKAAFMPKAEEVMVEKQAPQAFSR